MAVGATNGTATDKLVAALEACGCDNGKEILEEQRLSWLRSPSGSSVVTDGLTISDSAALTMYLLPAKISTLWYSIPRFTPTQADSLPRLPRLVLLHSSLLAVKRSRRKTWQAIAMSYGYVYVAQISMGADFNQTA